MSEQQKPVRNNQIELWPAVIEEMKARHQVGVERYGTPLQPLNGRDFLRDLSEELLDAVVYCRGLREELRELGQMIRRARVLVLHGHRTLAHALLVKICEQFPFLKE